MSGKSLAEDHRPRDEALAAVARGWQVIPLHSVVNGHCTCRRASCATSGKHPLNTSWPEGGTVDPARVEVMFGTDLGLENQGACTRVRVDPPTIPNLGILTGTCSGLIVLDIDPRNGGNESLEDLEDEHGRLPETVMVFTGGGGQHYYFSITDGLVLGGTKVARGVDLKAERGFVVGPGSRHHSGKSYEWELSSHPDDVGVAPAPRWLVEVGKKTFRHPRSAYYRPRTLQRPASPQEQMRFRELWEKVGITIDPATEAFYVCPFHDDHDPSLHIDPRRTVWYCFGCKAQGGLRDLEGQLSQEVVTKEVPITTSWDISGIPEPSTWERPPPPSPRCGRVRQLHRNREAHERHRGVGVLCGELGCSICGPFLKKDWETHLQLSVLKSDGRLNLLLCTPAEWATVRRAINRDPQGRTNFVHFDFSETGIPLGETTQVIITTATDIGKPVDTREAIRLVLHLLRALPFDAKRISTSEAWQKVKTKPVKTGEWERVAPITCTLKESAAGAESVGLHPHAIRLLRRATQAPWAEAYEVDIPLETSRWEWFIYMAEITEGVDSDELDRETGLMREEVAGSWSGKEAG